MTLASNKLSSFSVKDILQLPDAKNTNSATVECNATGEWKSSYSCICISP